MVVVAVVVAYVTAHVEDGKVASERRAAALAHMAVVDAAVDTGAAHMAATDETITVDCV